MASELPLPFVRLRGNPERLCSFEELSVGIGLLPIEYFIMA